MRLDEAQKKALKIALLNLQDNDEVFLFGSRIDDNKRGGDIDLLVYSKQPGLELSRKLSREFFKHCEEKIDILVVDPEKMNTEQAMFIQSIDKQPLKNL